MPGGSFYAPVFGRLFSRLSLTPASVTAATAFAAVGAYASVAEAHTGSGSILLMMAVFVTVVLAANPRGLFVWWFAPPLMLFGSWFVYPSAALGLVLGLGTSLCALGSARYYITKDDAFDNFDRLLALSTGALSWAVLGACAPRWWVAATRPHSSSDAIVPLSALGAVVLGLLFAAVVVIGDVRRLRWLRRVRSGELPFAVVSVTEQSELPRVPALIGGFTRSNAVLALRQTLESSAFRGGFRELLVARVPADLRRASRAVWLRLIGVGLSATVLVAVAAGAALGGR